MHETGAGAPGLSALGRSAAWYCEHGFAIIPIEPRGKRPVTRHGLNDWFDDPDDARKLWARHPDYNVGIVCGTPSHGLLAVDLDVSEDRDGAATLAAWEAAHGALPETAVALTGGGGRHYLFRTDRTNIHPSANAGLGVDVRCDGSYIVAPPSVHPSGATYEWWADPADVGVADADANVYDLLDHVQRNGGRDEGEPERGRFELPDSIGRGERNDTLFRYGRSLRARGLDDGLILSLLRDANRERCAEPLGVAEVEAVARSACSVGAGHDGAGGGRYSAAAVGAPGAGGAPPGDGDYFPDDLRTPRDAIRTNELAKVILRRNHARRIDGALAVWNGTRWEFGKAAINRAALSYADDCTKQQKAEVLSYIEDVAPSVTSERHFDGCHYVQFANATYDVMAGKVVEPRWPMLVTATLPVELDLDAPYGPADEFIASLAGGDEATGTVLCEVVGACMCSRRVVSQAPMLVGRAGGAGGEASNGKSTFLNVLRSLLGSDNVSSLDIATMGQRFQAGRIVGRLANLGDDIPDGFLRGDELSLFKKLVTGDSIYTDVKNASGFEFRPSATMVFSMNAVPRLADTSEGVFRRIAFVPFRSRFVPGGPGYDPHVADVMTRPENLQRLAVLGLMALPGLIRRGALTEIPDMAAELEAVRVDNSVVRRWLYDEGLDERHFDHLPTQDAFGEFTAWCDRSHERFGATKSKFTRELQKAFPNVKVSTLYSARHGKPVRTYMLQRNDGRKRCTTLSENEQVDMQKQAPATNNVLPNS